MWIYIFWTFIAILPFSFALNPAPTVDLQLARILALLIFALWLSAGLVSKQILFDKRPRFFLLILFSFICFLSFFWAFDQSRAIRKFSFLLNFLPLYLVAFSATVDKNQKRFLLMIFAWSTAFLSVLALLLFSAQFLLGIDTILNFISLYVSRFFHGNTFSEVILSYPSWLVNISGRNFIRAFGTFPDPHLFSLYLNMVIPLVYFLWLKTKSKKYLWMFGLILLASLLTFSRASYLSLGAAFLFVLFTSNTKNILKKTPLIFFVVTFLVVLFLAIPNPLSQRLASSFNLAEGSNQGRLEMWRKGVEVSLLFPWQGVGLGNFSKYISPQANYRDPIYAHNLFLDFGSETGIPNAIILFFLLTSPIVAFFKKPSLLSKTIAISFVIFITHSLFETPFFSIHLLPLLLILLGIKADEKNN